LKTGDVLAPPAYEGLHCFPVKLEDGVVWVRDDRWD
jgi:3-phenylpropionate/trans-cinnamate dioxygenase ferredoxin subunit